jgi:hypothetical protein
MATPGLTDMTALDFIKAALRKINVLASGETPTGTEQADALGILNRMLDSWNADRLTVYNTQIQDFPLVANQQVYTLGPNGNFNVARPAKITGASVVLLSNPLQPLERPLVIYNNDQEWQEVTLKLIKTTFPEAVYDDDGFPLRSLSFWPIPQEADTFRMYSWQPMTAAASLTTVLTNPPGYAEAIEYNLAVRLASEFGGSVTPLIAASAVQSLANIKAANVQPVLLACGDEYVGDMGRGQFRAENFNIP